MKAGQVRLAAALAALCAAMPLGASPPSDRGAIEQIETAYRVAEWARAHADAQGLVTAATMLAAIETRPPADSGVIEPPAHPAPRADKLAPPATDVASLLDAAEALSDGDPGLLAAIAARRQEAAKGVAFSSFGNGPIRITREIPARATWRIELTARAGEPLRVIAIGDGDTDVDIEIRDAAGRIACDDRSAGHHASCGLTPAFAGRYTARIVNQGLVWTRATLVSN